MSAEIGSVVLRLEAQTAQFEKGMHKAHGSSMLLQMGLSMVAFAAVGMAKDLAKAAAVLSLDFGQAIADAGAKASATAQEMIEMGEAAKLAGLRSAFGAGDAAEAMAQMAQAGLTVRDQITALNSTLDLASAGTLGVAEASKITVNALNAFRLSADEAGRVADIFARASVEADTTVSELGEALANAGGIAGATGQKLEGIVTVLAIMQNAGIKAAQAGTAVKSALASLVQEGGKAQGVMKELGVQIREPTGELRQFNEIIADMVRFGALPSDFVDAFGKKIGPKLLAATSKGVEGLENFNEMLLVAGGSAKEIAERQLDTLLGQLTLLKGSVETLVITIGEQFTPVLIPLVTGLKDSANETLANKKAFADLGAEVGKTSEAIADFTDSLAAAYEDSGISVFTKMLDKLVSIKNIAMTLKKLFRVAFVAVFGEAALAAIDFAGVMEKIFGRAEAGTDKMSRGLREIAKRFRKGAEAARDFALAQRIAATGYKSGVQQGQEVREPSVYGAGAGSKDAAIKRRADLKDLAKRAKANDSARKAAAKKALSELERDTKKAAKSKASALEKSIKDQIKARKKLVDDEKESISKYKDLWGKAVESVQKIKEGAAEDRSAYAARQKKIADEIRREGVRYLNEVTLKLEARGGFFSKLEKAISSGIGKLAGVFAGTMSQQGGAVGAVGALGSGAFQGLAAGGPVGALAGAGTALLGLAAETEGFKSAIAKVNSQIAGMGIGEKFNELVGKVFGTFASDLVMMAEAFKSLGPSMTLLSDAMGGAFTVAVKALAIVIMVFVDTIVLAILPIVALVAGFVNVISMLATALSNIWKGNADLKTTADGLSDAKDRLNSVVVDMSAGLVKSNVDTVKGLFDKNDTSGDAGGSGEMPADMFTAAAESFEGAGDAVDGFTDSVSKASSSMLNVPVIFQANLRRTQRALAGRGFGLTGAMEQAKDPGAGSLSGGAAGSIVNVAGDLVVQTDGATPDEIIKQLARASSIQTGSARANWSDPSEGLGL